jgi:hypothetical protein
MSDKISSVLHDATISVVTVDWARAVVTVRLTLCDDGTPEAELVVTGFTDVQLPRREPWGPSVSVNEATVSTDPLLGKQLHLQLQSGDILRVEAASIAFIRSDRPGAVVL